MAYRIRYGGKTPRNKTGNRTMLKIQALAAMALAVCLFITGLWFPGGQETLSGIFLPKDGTAVGAMARELSQSGSLHDSVVVFCRQVLINAGYEA